MQQRWFRLILGFGMACALWAASAFALQVVAAPVEPPDVIPFGTAVPGRVVVGVSPGLEESHLRALLARYGARLADWTPGLGLALADVVRGDEQAAMAAMRADPEIDFVADHRKVVHLADVPLDEYYPQQWGMDKVSGPAAWDLAWGDPSVVIAIVDTGVVSEHWDLRNQLWFNPGESAVNPVTGLRDCADPISHNGLDDDGNGYVDDCLGWDFVASGDPNPRDDTGHGTAVAGIALAETNNFLDGHYEGVAGMARGARMMVLKALDGAGGWPYDIAKAIDYAATSGAKVINLSLSLPPNYGYPGYLAMMQRAVERAQANDVLIVAATGNQNYPEVSYPAAFPGVLAVGASTEIDGRASFSNYGERMDLVAPGVNIFSTRGPSGDHDYGFYNGVGSGTSFSTPHVAGVAALVRALRPDLTYAEVRDLILATTDDVAATGWDQETGWGRLNAFRSVRAAVADLVLKLSADPPSVPRGGQTVVRLQITAPDHPGMPAGLGARVTLTASQGVISPTMVTVDSNGQAEARYTAGSVTGAAVVTATSGAANTTLPLTITSGLPAQLALAASPDRIASQGGQAQIVATVRDEGGSLVLDGTPVAFTTTLGTLAPLTATTSAGRAETGLTAGSISGIARVQAAAGAVSDEIAVQIVGAGEPFSITLVAEPGEILVAGEPATVTARVFDGVGGPVGNGTVVRFQSDLGLWAQEQVSTEDGVAETHFMAGTTPGLAHLLAASGAASGEAVVRIQPGLAQTLTVRAEPADLIAGPDQVSGIQVLAVDPFENPVADGTELVFETTLGQISPTVTTTLNGMGSAELTAGRIAGMSYITVTAASGAEGYAQVRIHPASPASLTLDALPKEIAVGGEVARLEGTLLDSYGNLVADGTVVTFTTDLGGLRLPVTHGEAADEGEASSLNAGTVAGVAVVELVSGEAAGTARVHATVRPDLWTVEEIRIRPGAAASLTMTVDPPRVRSGQRARVSVAVSDAFGNRVADGTVVALSASGDVTLDETQVPTLDGVAETWATAGTTPGTVLITATSGDRSAVGELTVALVEASLPLILRAQATR